MMELHVFSPSKYLITSIDAEGKKSETKFSYRASKEKKEDYNKIFF